MSGPVTALDTSGIDLRSEGPTPGVIGLEDHIVVSTPDAVLVCPMGRAKEVRLLAQEVAKDDQRD